MKESCRHRWEGLLDGVLRSLSSDVAWTVTWDTGAAKGLDGNVAEEFVVEVGESNGRCAEHDEGGLGDEAEGVGEVEIPGRGPRAVGGEGHGAPDDGVCTEECEGL